MGSHNGIKICELTGLYLLNQLSTVTDEKSVVLYRYHRIAAINNVNGPKCDGIKKKMITLFKEERISIIIKRNLIKTDILDVSLVPYDREIFFFSKG